MGGNQVKIGIIAAMEQEVRYLVQVMEEQTVIEKANQTFYDGSIKGQSVTVVQSGIGKVNATIATALLVETFGVDTVINTGSAGGIGEGLSVGDLVISTELAYNDADAQAFGYEYGQIPQMPARYKADDSFLEVAKEAAKETNWSTEKGLIVSGDSFIAGKKQVEQIKSFFPDALVTEMEGTAVAQTCYQFNVPFLVVRAISDTADEEAGVSFEEFIERVGEQSAKFVVACLDRLMKENELFYI